MGSFSTGREPNGYVTRIVEYEGEKWRCTSFSGTHATMDIVNVPGEAVQNRVLRLPRKVFFEHLLPRIKGGNT